MMKLWSIDRNIRRNNIITKKSIENLIWKQEIMIMGGGVKKSSGANKVDKYLNFIFAPLPLTRYTSGRIFHGLSWFCSFFGLSRMDNKKIEKKYCRLPSLPVQKKSVVLRGLNEWFDPKHRYTSIFSCLFFYFQIVQQLLTDKKCHFQG